MCSRLSEEREERALLIVAETLAFVELITSKGRTKLFMSHSMHPVPVHLQGQHIVANRQGDKSPSRFSASKPKMASAALGNFDTPTSSYISQLILICWHSAAAGIAGASITCCRGGAAPGAARCGRRRTGTRSRSGTPCWRTAPACGESATSADFQVRTGYRARQTKRQSSKLPQVSNMNVSTM